jgi:hypothetical protein
MSNLCGFIARGKWVLTKDKTIVFTPEAGCKNVSENKDECAISSCQKTLEGQNEQQLRFPLSSDWEKIVAEEFGALPVDQNIYFRSYSAEQRICNRDYVPNLVRV